MIVFIPLAITIVKDSNASIQIARLKTSIAQKKKSQDLSVKIEQLNTALPVFNLLIIKEDQESLSLERKQRRGERN